MTITAHDFRDPACGCSSCIENRRREEQEELHAQRLLEENQARNRERQLRCIHPLLTFGVDPADYGDREDEQRRTEPGPDDEQVPAEAMQMAGVAE